MIRKFCFGLLAAAVVLGSVAAMSAENPPGPLYTADVDCDGQPTVADKMHCEQLRLDKAEERLAQVGKRLSEALPRNLRLKFEASQGSWLSFRDAHFDFTASMHSTIGQEGLWMQVRNLRRMTEKRVLELEALLESARFEDFGHEQPEHKAPAATPTVIRSRAEAELLAGEHGLRLQWINEEPTGRATVRDQDGVWVLEGAQEGGGSLRMHGVIVEIKERSFVLGGTIITEIAHIAGGKPCVRSGEFLFLRRKGRLFWRMQDIDNPCSDVVDYIDMFR